MGYMYKVICIFLKNIYKLWVYVQSFGVYPQFYYMHRLHSDQVRAFRVSITQIMYSVPTIQFLIIHSPPTFSPFQASIVSFHEKRDVLKEPSRFKKRVRKGFQLLWLVGFCSSPPFQFRCASLTS